MPGATETVMKKKTSPPKKSSKARSNAKTPSKKRLTKLPAEPDSLGSTLGELDLYLFGEGRHELIYEKLGAHRLTHDGVNGVSFAVWAPAADRVCVVGNFNAWDGKQHPMRPVGSSGVGETFVPNLEPGELYKYEIKTPGLGK